MTNKEKAAKLDITIQKRLGVKAKALWNDLKSDLSFADLIRNHINLVSMPKVEKDEQGNFTMNVYYDFYCKQLNKEMDEIIIRQVEMWLLQNIDKDRLKEWLEK